MNPVALRVAYDGAEFAGWQVQPGKRTIQGALQAALDRVHGVPPGTIALAGAGRTDAGVHALGQVAAYIPPTPRPPEVLLSALIGLLPDAIRVLNVWTAPEGFHARRSAIGKVYRYRIVNRPFALPFETPWAWHVRQPLDLAAMRAALEAFVGRRDFAAFVSAGGQTRTTVRTLNSLTVAEGQGRLVEIEGDADGFLYRMMRNVVGYLVEVGAGRRPPDDAPRVLASASRSHGGLTAPARGLCLARVRYPAGATGEDTPPACDAAFDHGGERPGRVVSGG